MVRRRSECVSRDHRPLTRLCRSLRAIKNVNSTLMVVLRQKVPAEHGAGYITERRSQLRPHPECRSHRFSRIFCCIYSIIRRIIAAKPMPVSLFLLVVSRRRWTYWTFKEAAQRQTSKSSLPANQRIARKTRSATTAVVRSRARNGCLERIAGWINEPRKISIDTRCYGSSIAGSAGRKLFAGPVSLTTPPG